MAPALWLRCGCEVPFDATSDSAPVCPVHGNQSVRRVLRMPKPRIRGVASGPVVQTVALPPLTAPLTPSLPREET